MIRSILQVVVPVAAFMLLVTKLRYEFLKVNYPTRSWRRATFWASCLFIATTIVGAAVYGLWHVLHMFFTWLY